MSQNLYPLKPFPVAILTALAAGEAHAYAIEQRMISDVQGAIFVQSRAVYRDLPRLAQAGLIESIPDTKPQKYRLTKRGRTNLLSVRAQSLQIFKLLQERL